MEEAIVILISNVFLPQKKKKNNPVIQKERIKTRKSTHVFLLLVNRFWGEGRSLTDLAKRGLFIPPLFSSVFDSLQSSSNLFIFYFFAFLGVNKIENIK